MNDDATPLVSACVVTWNHERWLGEALDGVLSQTYPNLEVVVGVDRCDDRTEQVAREYARRDERVRVLGPEPERLRGRANFLRTFGAARGRYVAWCDGDDVWFEPTKLERQVAELEAEPAYSGCVHDSHDMDAAGRTVGRVCRPFVDREAFGPEELAERIPAMSCTLVYRRELFDPFPDWIHDTPTGDWPLMAHLSTVGPVRYLSGDWAGHRVHDEGVWSRLGAQAQFESRRRTREALAERVLGPRYAEAVRAGEDRDLMQLARGLERSGERTRALEILDELRERGAPGQTVPRGRFWKRYLRTALRAKLSGDRAGAGADASP